MLGLLLLRHYSARAWTWPPLLWWETGLLLLLNGFSLSYAGPLFQPWAAEILQTGGRSHISSDLYLFPGAWPLIEPWAAEILQKGAPQPDIKRGATWFFSVPSPHIEAVPLSALSVPVLCACVLVRVAFFWQIPLAQLVEQMALNLKVKNSTPPWLICLSFLLAFACRVVRVLLLEGKCIASLQEDPAEDSLCLACFCCATTVQGLNLTSASVMGNWTASFAERLLLILRWTPFPAMSGRDPPKRGAAATSVQTFTFFQALDPLLSRERPRSSKKGRRNLTSNVLPFGSSQRLCHT